MEKKNKLHFGMLLVTIGIVYGDIGTSPMYVMKSILEGNGGIGDRHMDLYWGCWSLNFNLKDSVWCSRFLDAYGKDMEFCQIQLNYLDWTLQSAKEKYDSK